MKIGIQALVALLLFGQTTGQECDSDGNCDTHARCPVWEEEGECYRNEAYMSRHCPVTCRLMEKRPTNWSCKDAHPRCSFWADLGECTHNAEMRKYCAKSCDTCTGKRLPVDEFLCVDTNDKCRFWADQGECLTNPKYMEENCQKSCDSCKQISPADRKLDKVNRKREADRKLDKVNRKREADRKLEKAEETVDESTTFIVDQSTAFGDKQAADGADGKATLDQIEATIAYMKSDDVQTLSTEFRDNCRNKHKLCSFWAVIGECEKNKAFMKINCAPACQSCHLLDMGQRCPTLEDAVPGLRPGDMNKMFERIVATAPGNRTLPDDERRKLAEEEMTEYSVVVHSRPSEEPATEISAFNEKSLPPWVITFENFLTPEECDTMIQLGYEVGYKRSEDVGKQKLDGTVDSVKSTGRTSENAWCSTRTTGCREKEVPVRLHKRMSTVMGIPPENTEDLQLLKYEVGQFYKTHHDYIPHQEARQCGPRILTFFIYLSDVDAGGGTNFPDLGLTIMPKKGRALLWPSVLDSNPMAADNRMRHQALPVEAGTKFAANGWIHMFDYIGPQERSCN